MHELCLNHLEQALQLYDPQFHRARAWQVGIEPGIFCLCESCDNFPMWSLYADSHKGVAVGFDAQVGKAAEAAVFGAECQAAAIDQLTDALLARRKANVRATLDANRHLIEALRDALLDRDELIGDDITAVLEQAGLPVRTGVRIERRGEDRRRRDWLAEGG